MSNNKEPDSTTEDFISNLINNQNEYPPSSLTHLESAQFRNFREENNRLLRKLYFETGAQKKSTKKVEPPNRIYNKDSKTI